MELKRRRVLLAMLGGLGGLGFSKFSLAGDLVARKVGWDAIISAARGQTVRFNAWAGDQKINSYIAWAGQQVERDFGVKLIHIKISDTSEAVRKILAEKVAGLEDGSVDLIWINGANFSTMKSNNLLHGPFADALPNYHLTDPKNQPTITSDFTVPTDGYEAPWGRANFVLIYNKKRVANPPRTFTAIGDWARKHAGRFTYPLPPDFTGVSFLKQVLIELNHDNQKIFTTSPSDDVYNKASGKLWAWLDELHPYLWREGKAFPANYAALRQMLNDRVVDFAMAYNPNEAAVSIIKGLLPAGMQARVSDLGGLANTHFLAIPFNSKRCAGAEVVANFLLSPMAQARKADLEVWGDPSVLAPHRLDAGLKTLFDDMARHPAQPSADELSKALAEPHPAWSQRLEKDWSQRYGVS